MFHSIPKNPGIALRWMKQIGIESTTVIVGYICSEHFSKDDIIVRPNGVIRLRKNAIPMKLARASDESAVSAVCSNGIDSTAGEKDSNVSLESIEPIEAILKAKGVIIQNQKREIKAIKKQLELSTIKIDELQTKDKKSGNRQTYCKKLIMQLRQTIRQQREMIGKTKQLMRVS